jgi:hypothetical protein
VKYTVSVEGFKDLEKALEDLTKAAGKNALRRGLQRAAVPLRDTMKAYAPGIAGGGLKESISIGPKLNPRQAKLHRKAVSERSGVELFVGPSYKLGRGGRSAHLFEFGTRERVQKTTGRRTGRIEMQPFMRPAWDSKQAEAFSVLTFSLREEIEKATDRARRKAERQARRLSGV